MQPYEVSTIQVPVENIGRYYPSIVVLVVTRDKRGRANIMPAGYSTKVSSEPPMVAVGIKPERYSHESIEDQGEFVLAVPTKEILSKLNYCGSHSGKDIDKFKETGLTSVPAKVIRAPLIRECAINLECSVAGKMRTGSHTLFIGKIVAVHVRRDFLDDKCDLNMDKAALLISHGEEYRVVGNILGTRSSLDSRSTKTQF